MTDNTAAMKLLPCPWHEKDAVLIKGESGDLAYCVHPGCPAGYITTLERWNTRAQPQVGEDTLIDLLNIKVGYKGDDWRPVLRALSPYLQPAEPAKTGDDAPYFVFRLHEAACEAGFFINSLTETEECSKRIRGLAELAAYKLISAIPPLEVLTQPKPSPDAVAIVRQLREDLAKIAPHPSGATTDEAPELKACWYEAIAQNALHTADAWLEKVGA